MVSEGRKSNAQLLMLYGFSMERNTQDKHGQTARQLCIVVLMNCLVLYFFCCPEAAMKCFFQQLLTATVPWEEDFVTFAIGQLLENSPFSEVCSSN